MAKSGKLSPQNVPYSDLEHFVNADGQCIYCKYWEPPAGTPVRALLHVIHGMGEHCERYNKIAEHYNKHGILVFAHDHIGHGKSEGPRADVKHFQFFVRDCHQHIGLMRSKYKDLPIFLFGHSMGGTIAVLVGYERPSLFANSGVILCAPAIKANPDIVTPFKLFLGRMLANVLPHTPMGKLEPSDMSRDPEVVKDYENDPLVYHGKVMARLAIQTLQAMDRIEVGLPDVRWPFLLQHGDQDKLAEISGSRLMYEKAPSEDKTFTVYEGCFHELDKEPGEDGERATKEVVDWVLQRLPSQ
ncbi:monoglyceride lipase-like [Patiria miniata]|uniref:Serine aminopeptidase S33 domain-containing protein n=1 Tax=Patiria miniata TaxID=46514 RepID=A0A914AU72_PATMI|nr:monoglyceride lipase-like [Patiria miniata]